MRKGIDHIAVGVVFACHDGAGNFVFSKRSANCRDEHGTWDPGGGGIEFGDTAEATLRKEILEEYCAPVLDYEYLGYRDVFRLDRGMQTHWVMHDFKVLVDRAQVANGEPHKMDAVEWFTLDTVPQPWHSEWPRFLNLYRGKLLATTR